LCGYSIASISLSHGGHKAVVVTTSNEMVEVRCKLAVPTAEELAEAAEAGGEGEGAIPASKGQLGDDLHVGPIISSHFLLSSSKIISSAAKLLSGGGFVTAGADRTVRIWQAMGEGDALTGFKPAKIIKMDAPCTAVSVSNVSLAVSLFGGENATRNGSIHLFSLPDGAFLMELPPSLNVAVKELKMSAEGNLIAVLRENSSLEIFVQTEGQWALRGTIQDSLSDQMTNFDLSVDNLFVRGFFTPSQDLKVFDINAGETFGKELFVALPPLTEVVVNKEEGEEPVAIPGAAQLEQLRSIQWASQNCPYNWDSVGVRSLELSTFPKRFDRSNYLLLSSDEVGIVEISRLPALTVFPTATILSRQFSAHTGPLCGLFFFEEGGARLLTLGEKDGVLRVWKVSYDGDEFEADPIDAVDGNEEAEKPPDEEEDGEGKTTLPELYDSGDEEDFEDGISLKKHVLRNAMPVTTSETATELGVVSRHPTSESILKSYCEAVDVKEISSLSHVCADALHVSETTLTPSDDLALDWVYGSTVRQTRNSVKYTSKGEIVYPAGAVAIIFDKVNNHQVLVSYVNGFGSYC
jgi:hypothetical protein